MGASTTAIRILSIFSVIILTIVMIRLALRPHWPQTTHQVLFLTAIIGFGWLGAIGVIINRISATVVGAIGLFLLGFWQAVLSVVMLPTAFLLIVAGVATHAVNDNPHES